MPCACTYDYDNSNTHGRADLSGHVKKINQYKKSLETISDQPKFKVPKWVKVAAISTGHVVSYPFILASDIIVGVAYSTAIMHHPSGFLNACWDATEWSWVKNKPYYDADENLFQYFRSVPFYIGCSVGGLASLPTGITFQVGRGLFLAAVDIKDWIQEKYNDLER